MTNETKTVKSPAHTPGPWVYEDEFGQAGLILTSEGEAIAAFMPDGVGNEPRMKANAHLIAAAPEMLEAAQTVAALLLVRRWCPNCGYPEDVDIKPMPHTNTCYFPGLLAAIAKATGAQS